MLGTRCRGRLTLALASTFSFAVAGCGGGSSVPPHVVSVGVEPEELLVAQGFPRQLAAVAHLSDGSSRDVTASASWSSSAPGHVSVAGGLASFVAVGAATLTATDPESGLSGSAEAPAYHLAFVTSSSGNARLGEWADHAGTATGADAGDEICQERAAAAGLPGTFRAWLSDGSDDAYCRVQGLHGRKAGSCGQASLPSTGGPWQRMDGHPFAPALGELGEGELYTAVRFDETAAPSAGGFWANTGTDGAESPYYAACDDWTSLADSSDTSGGDALAVDFFWTYGVAPACSATMHLLCLQAGGGPAFPPKLLDPPGAKRAFITSTIGTGNLGAWADAGGATGIAAGDAICAARADAAGLGGTFRAWLSDANTDAIDRLPSDGPWVRIDGAAIAADKAGLAAGALLANPLVTEDGTYLVPLGGGGESLVWTGTLADGTRAAQSCQGWTSARSSDSGLEGFITYLLPSWTENGPAECDYTWLHLYCFEE